MKINNISSTASNYKYIVARKVDDEFWFWGAYNNFANANKASREVNGVVFCNADVFLNR